MSNNSLLLVDPDFKADATDNCHLLLKITNDSFSYAVLNKDSEEINLIFDKQGCTNLEQDLKTAFETDQFLSGKYLKVKAAVHTSNFIFVPDEWFDAKNISVYSKFLGTDKELHTIPHAELGFHTIYSLNQKIENTLPENTAIYPQSSPLLALHKHISEDGLVIDFTANSFNVLFIKGGKIHFQNHYESESPEEFNYFLLLIIEQLGLSEITLVYLQGIINEDDEYYNTLLKYFNNLYFFLPAGTKNSELLADMPKHYFSGLLALDLCE
ncbi:DUF3822 family protein [Pedobacter sp. BMA]|uniref:DUF3822 family protein n=1 Tax=Pedobacter sp. BMA TaxID=1663685 RepID=UPI000649B0B0|nr:DUF3822 family protein [Pedobacter sp. BMA]KLT67364.1 hypothetical protein AB669_01250 [Pedobacter sp. BMA]